MKIRFILLVATLVTCPALADELNGRVVGVTDGDTITLLDQTNTQYKVRLSGIDSPEKKQAYGQAAKKSLSDLVYGKTVVVDWHKEDRYGRIVGKVLYGGQDMNLEQIKRGFAWFYRKYQNELILNDRLMYLSAEQEAQRSGFGLWGDEQPIPPWEFRKK